MKDNGLIPKSSNNNGAKVTRQGVFEQGFDKLGRPYEKKLDTNGVYTKEEKLKSGYIKQTVKTPINK